MITVKSLEFEEEPPRRADAAYSVLECHGVLVPYPLFSMILRVTPWLYFLKPGGFGGFSKIESKRRCPKKTPRSAGAVCSADAPWL
jgi:hypothetical protein